MDKHTDVARMLNRNQNRNGSFDSDLILQVVALISTESETQRPIDGILVEVISVAVKFVEDNSTPMSLQYSSSESGKKLKFPNISVVALHYVHAKWRNTRYGYRPTLYGIHVRLHNNNAFHLF